MGREVKGRMTPEGLVIPRSALEGWRDVELEIVQDEHGIVIRPKSAGPAQRGSVSAVLRETGPAYKSRPAATVQMTPKGLLVPHTLIQGGEESEVIAEPQRIIIRPKETDLTEYERTVQVLEACGFLLSSEPLPENYVPLSEEEKETLRQALSVGKPLSHIVLENREERENALPGLTFLCADERLLAVAAAEGLAVDNPNEHP